MRWSGRSGGVGRRFGRCIGSWFVAKGGQKICGKTFRGGFGVQEEGIGEDLLEDGPETSLGHGKLGRQAV